MMVGKILTFVVCFVVMIGLMGCSDQQAGTASGTATPASLAVRAKRVAYSGAPPVIPHQRQSGKCTTCHSTTGGNFPGIGSGFAPANPHIQTAGMSDQSRCLQCHVFTKAQDEFQESEFVGLTRSVHGEQAFTGAPPVIPHHLFMREDCLACHSGASARPEIRCTHPERARCMQCHLQCAGDIAPQIVNAELSR